MTQEDSMAVGMRFQKESDNCAFCGASLQIDERTIRGAFILKDGNFRSVCVPCFDKNMKRVS
jgi:hypothetical protein